MFAKDKVTKSMIEAVNSVLMEKKMDEAELDETGLRKAAYAAHKAGQSHFEFQGKKYPVKVRGESVEAGEAIDEASVKVPTKTGMIVYGGAKGGSAKAYKDQHGDPFAGAKGPSDKELKAVEKEKTKKEWKEEVEEDFNIEDFSLEEIKEFMQTEEYEQLDELSKKTLASYTKKVLPGVLRGQYNRGRKDVQASSRPGGFNPFDSKRHSRMKGLEKAVGRMAKEEVELDEANITHAAHFEDPKTGEWTSMALITAKDDKGAVAQAHDLAKSDAYSKYRLSSVERHTTVPNSGDKKKMKEEVESLEEISKKTLASYAHKATGDLNFTSHMRGSHLAHGEKDSAKSYEKPNVNRQKGLHKAIDRLAKEDTSFSNRLIKSLYENKANQPQETFTDNNMGEAKMTDAQMKKREKIVMSMKDKTADFKSKYGKNWKNVMYATATKQAMKEDVELSEAEVTAKASDTEEVTTDMLRGRVQGGKANSFKSFKLQLRTDGEMKAPPVEKGEDTREKQKITTNPVSVDIKFDDKLGHPTVQSHFSDEKHITSEETVSSVLKSIRNKEASMRNKEIDSFTKKVKEEKHDDEAEDKKLIKKMIKPDCMKEEDATFVIEDETLYQINEEKPEHTHVAHYEDKDGNWMAKLLINAEHDGHAIEHATKAIGKGPFAGLKIRKVERVQKVMEEIDLNEWKKETDWKETPKDVTDKSGAKHTPMSRVKDLAKAALKRVKSETMMGKLGTSEEVEHMTEDSMLDAYLSSKGMNPEVMPSQQKISYAKSNEFLKWKKDHS